MLAGRAKATANATPVEAPVDPARVPTLAIVALSFGAFGSQAALRVCDPMLPRIETEFGIGLAAASQVVMVFAVAYGLLQLVYGPLGDRFGKYRVVTAACAASALTSIGCALAPSFASLVVARLLAGATAGALIPLSMAWIGDVVAYQDRQAVLAKFLFGHILGFAFGQFLGGVAAENFSLRAPFFVLAAWFAVAALLMYAMRSADPHRLNPAGMRSGTLAGVVRIRWARVVLITVFLEGAFLFGSIAFAVTHVHLHYGLSLGAAGSVLMLFAAGGACYAALAGRLVRRLGEGGLSRAGGVIVFAAMATIALSTYWPLAALGCVAIGLGFYMFHNTLQTNATQMAPEQRGSAVSSFAASLFIGQSIGVALAGALAERAGTTSVLLVGGAGVFCTGWLFGRLRAQRTAAALR